MQQQHTAATAVTAATNTKKSTTSGTGSRPTVRCGNVKAVQCRSISACPSQARRSRETLNQSQFSQVSQAIQSYDHHRPCPPPIHQKPAVGLSIVSSRPPCHWVVQSLPPLPSSLLCFSSRPAQLTIASLPSLNSTRSHPRFHVDIERQPQSRPNSLSWPTRFELTR